MPTNKLLTIDADSGTVIFAGLALTPRFDAAQLPDTFTRQLFNAGDRRGFFGTTSVTEESILYEAGLRFEAEKLIRIDLTITPPEHRDLQGDAFYHQTDARYAFHARWLKKQLHPHRHATWGHMYEFAWGLCGVARDKSENVGIFLDYETTDFATRKGVAAADKVRGCSE